MNLLSALLEPSQVPMKYPVLSTGLSLLNLALSGESEVGLQSGSVVWVSGPSDSGRSTLCLTILAEASENGYFSDHALIYDDTEGQNIDIAGYFGNKVNARIRRRASYGEEEFWNEMMDMDRPCIYVLDSLDGLGTSKRGWKVNNQQASCVFAHFRKLGSILVLTAQEKKVDGQKKVAAGGYAVQFYADYCLRTTSGGCIFRPVAGKRRHVGTNTEIGIIKSVSGLQKIDSVPAPVFAGAGYDNAESVLLFMLRVKMAMKRGQVYSIPQFDFAGNLEEVLNFIRDFEPVIVNTVTGGVV